VSDTHPPADPRPVDAVEVYWRPGCPYCLVLRRGLARAGVPVREINIWSPDQPEAAARVRAVAGGNETVPTVFIDGHPLVAPKVGQVLAALASIAPALLPPPGAGRQGRGLLARLRGSRRTG
jgi:mycoredoxin